MPKLKSNIINYSSMIYEELIPLLESNYGEPATISLFLNYGTPAIMTVINILNSKSNLVVYSKYAKSLDMVHEHLMETSHQYMTVADSGNAVENEIESGVVIRLSSVIYTNDINFLNRPLNHRLYIAINIPNSACMKNIDRYALIYPKCRDPDQNINSSQSSTISYLNRDKRDIISQILKFLLDISGQQGRTLVVVPDRNYLNAISDSFTANGLIYSIMGQEDNYESEQYANLCLTLTDALSGVVVSYDTVIDTGLSSIKCITGFGLHGKKIVQSTYNEVICRTSGSTKNAIVVANPVKSRHCVSAYDRKTLNKFGYILDFDHEIESYKWAQHDALLIDKFKISPEYVNLPLSVLSMSIMQSWIKIKTSDNSPTDLVVQEAITIASILDNLNNYIFKTMPTREKYSQVDYDRRLNIYRTKYFDKFKGNTPIETIFNIWNEAMSHSSGLEEWCNSNNIVYNFLIDILDTIRQVSEAYGNLREIDMKLPDNVYHMLEPLIYATYNHLSMRWIGEATYESLYAMHHDNKTSLKTVKLDLDPEVGYYDNEDVGLTLPSGEEKPVYVSFMPPYLIPMGVDKDSGIIMSYIPLRNMPSIGYSEYGMPYPL